MDKTADAAFLITDEEQLRSIYPSPRFLPVLEQLDRSCKLFIEHSPLVMIATRHPELGIDVSPRGDAPGFVQVLDDHTLLIPDRTGNNRLDCMTSILDNGEIGLFFLIPGLIESLRIKGTATLSLDPELMAATVADGKLPRSVIVVTVHSAFIHCGKAVNRSRMWGEQYKMDPKAWTLARGTLENSAYSGIELSGPE